MSARETAAATRAVASLRFLRDTQPLYVRRLTSADAKAESFKRLADSLSQPPAAAPSVPGAPSDAVQAVWAAFKDDPQLEDAVHHACGMLTLGDQEALRRLAGLHAGDVPAPPERTLVYAFPRPPYGTRAAAPHAAIAGRWRLLGSLQSERYSFGLGGADGRELALVPHASHPGAHAFVAHMNLIASGFEGKRYIAKPPLAISNSARIPQMIAQDWRGLREDEDQTVRSEHRLKELHLTPAPRAYAAPSDAQAADNETRVAAVKSRASSLRGVDALLRSPLVAPPGLVNLRDGLTNVCYQNSALQALAMTDGLRRLLLTAPLAPLAPGLTPREAPSHVFPPGYEDGFGFSIEDLPGAADATAPAPTAGAASDAKDPASSSLAVAPSAPLSASRLRELGRDAALTNRLQWLLARLSLSQRPVHATHALQGVLDQLQFERGKQQDVSEFLVKIGEAITTAMSSPALWGHLPGGEPPFPHVGPYERLFGGITATVRLCRGPRPALATDCAGHAFELTPAPARASAGQDGEVDMASGAGAANPTGSERCGGCSGAKVSVEAFSLLQLQFPQAFTPVTSVIAVASKAKNLPVELPPGYLRVEGGETNRQSWNMTAPVVTLAVSRDDLPSVADCAHAVVGGGAPLPSCTDPLGPITDIHLVVGPPAPMPLPVPPADAIPPVPGCAVNLPYAQPLALAGTPLVLPEVPHGWSLLPTDLAAGCPAGVVPGRIFLAFTRAPTAAPITDVRIVDLTGTLPPGWERLPSRLSGVPPSTVGYTLAVQRLREVTGIAVTRSSTSEVPPGHSFIASHLETYVELAIAGRRAVGLPESAYPPSTAAAVSAQGSDQRWPLWPVMTVTHARGIGAPFTSLRAIAAKAVLPAEPGTGAPAPLVAPTVDDLRAADAEVSQALDAGYELVSAPDDPVAGHHLLARRGGGCPITELAVFRAPQRVPDNQGWESLTLLPPPVAQSGPESSSSWAAGMDGRLGLSGWDLSALSAAPSLRGRWSTTPGFPLVGAQRLLVAKQAPVASALLVNGSMRLGPAGSGDSALLSGVFYRLSAPDELEDRWAGQWSFIGRWNAGGAWQPAHLALSLAASPSSSSLLFLPGASPRLGYAAEVRGNLFRMRPQPGTAATVPVHASLRSGAHMRPGRLLDVCVVTEKDAAAIEAGAGLGQAGYTIVRTSILKASAAFAPSAAPAAAAASSTAAAPATSAGAVPPLSLSPFRPTRKLAADNLNPADAASSSSSAAVNPLAGGVRDAKSLFGVKGGASGVQTTLTGSFAVAAASHAAPVTSGAAAGPAQGAAIMAAGPGPQAGASLLPHSHTANLRAYTAAKPSAQPRGAGPIGSGSSAAAATTAVAAPQPVDSDGRGDVTMGSCEPQWEPPSPNSALFLAVRYEMRSYVGDAPVHDEATAPLAAVPLPIAEVAVIARRPGDKLKSWDEMLPPGFELVRYATASTALPPPVALGAADPATAAGQYLAIRRLASEEARHDPSAPCVTGLDVLWASASESAKFEAPLHGYRRLERSGYAPAAPSTAPTAGGPPATSPLPSPSAGRPSPAASSAAPSAQPLPSPLSSSFAGPAVGKQTYHTEPVALNGPGSERDARRVQLAVRTQSLAELDPSAADCPLTGEYGPAPDGSDSQLQSPLQSLQLRVVDELSSESCRGLSILLGRTSVSDADLMAMAARPADAGAPGALANELRDAVGRTEALPPGWALGLTLPLESALKLDCVAGPGAERLPALEARGVTGSSSQGRDLSQHLCTLGYWTPPPPPPPPAAALPVPAPAAAAATSAAVVQPSQVASTRPSTPVFGHSPSAATATAVPETGAGSAPVSAASLATLVDGAASDAMDTDDGAPVPAVANGAPAVTSGASAGVRPNLAALAAAAPLTAGPSAPEAASVATGGAAPMPMKPLPAASQPAASSAGPLAVPAPLPFTLVIDPNLIDATGHITAPTGDALPWALYAEHALQIAWKRDTHTLYDDQGRLRASARVARYDMQSLLRMSTQPHLLALSNRVDCDACGARTDHESTAVLLGQPHYLAVQLVRMSYEGGRPSKTSTAVDIDTVLEVPAPEAEVYVQAVSAIDAARGKQHSASPDAGAGAASMSIDAGDENASVHPHAPSTTTTMTNSMTHSLPELSPAVYHLAPRITRNGGAYGLYAIMVHRGGSLQSGHYYAYARRSDSEGGDLRLRDDPCSPWLCLNDERVTPMKWADIRRALMAGNDESAYVLCYRRLGPAAGPAAAAAAAAGGADLMRGEPADLLATKSGEAAGLPASATQPWLGRVIDDNWRHVAARLAGRHSRFLLEAQGIAAVASPRS